MRERQRSHNVKQEMHDYNYGRKQQYQSCIIQIVVLDELVRDESQLGEEEVHDPNEWEEPFEDDDDTLEPIFARRVGPVMIQMSKLYGRWVERRQ